VIEHAKATMEPLVKRFEGLHRLKNGLVYPYLCPAGYWTHGYGKLCSKDTPPITPQEAEEDLATLMPGYLAEALKLAPRLWLVPPEVLGAIGDFVFNLGAARFRASTLRKKINEGDWEGALAELPKWKFGSGRVLPGLVLRRAAEAAIIKKSI
jgi:lysozyme